ncbi:bifunctional peptidase and arginyl-hydroxylase JMJD5-like [Hydractinia symbiolongicarpus]|uniref:bifunctional peptidase and arginyl-hydroxylase JMJD5-like n=1 Tax=Hydractinia symbiolongicarpus TaxID=13093 RepID=UPI00254EC0AE|nr:bifunctional peptidase and arginyl-hydroxylase JMJD5-like [Hydractinia symbiolongicarpus]
MDLYLYGLLLFFAAISAEPTGNMKPLGEQRKSEGHIDVTEDAPDVQTFFEKYIAGSRPIVFKGAAKNMPAFKKWNDEYLKEHFGELQVDVEEGKKENRSLSMWRWPFKKFLETYQKEDVYMVHSLEEKMRGDLRLFPSLSCGGYTRVLNDVVMWFSSGGTKSVLHNDHIDNVNCLFSGSKQLYMVDWKHREFIDIDAPNGAFSKVDVDAVDLDKYPGIAKAPWWEANMVAGDCLFIPSRWFHQVRSFTDNKRNMAVNVWFYHMQKLNLTDCEKNQDAGKYVPLDKFKFGDLESARYVLKLELQDGPLHVRKMTGRIKAHIGAVASKAEIKEVLSMLDRDGDKMVTMEELDNLTEDDLTVLSRMFPGLERAVSEEENGGEEGGEDQEGGVGMEGEEGDEDLGEDESLEPEREEL